MDRFHTAHFAADDRIVQDLDRLRPRKALAPGQCDDTRRRIMIEPANTQQTLGKAVRACGRARQDRHAKAARNHVSDRFEGPPLQSLHRPAVAKDATKRYYQQLNRYSANLALLSDISMAVLGLGA